MTGFKHTLSLRSENKESVPTVPDLKSVVPWSKKTPGDGQKTLFQRKVVEQILLPERGDIEVTGGDWR